MNLKKEETKNNITYIENGQTKKINKKKLVIAIIIASVIVIFAILFAVYALNEQFRTFCDTYVFAKDIEENNLNSIEIENINSSNVFAFSNSIAIIKENTIKTYNMSGKEENNINLEITTPLVATNSEYMAIAENFGQKIYLIYKNDIIWKKDLEGQISRVSVNQNGYISVVLSGTSYKSVIVLFDRSGNEVFKTYLSTTIAVDTDISYDNKYLAFAEINMSGTLIQSNIKIISIDKAKEDPTNAIIYTYKADANNLAIKIKYQNKNSLVCMYDNDIHVIENNEDKKISDLSSNNFADIDLYSYIVKVSEISNGIFNTKTSIDLVNSNTGNQNTYNLEGSIKELYCYGDKVGVNLGSEVYFVDMNGWLVKKYTSSQEIRGIVMSDRIAGIIYKNKIEIVNL